MIVVSSLPTSMRFAPAEVLQRRVLELETQVFAMTVPPVRIAMSSSMALRRSPKPGALTAVVSGCRGCC